MGLLDHTFNQTAKIYETEYNLYGDQVQTDDESWSCRLREISELQSGSNREDLQGVDAILWIDPEAPIEEGKIIEVDSTFWRIYRVTKARRFTSEVVFYKCLLQRHNGPLDEEELS